MSQQLDVDRAPSGVGHVVHRAVDRPIVGPDRQRRIDRHGNQHDERAPNSARRNRWPRRCRRGATVHSTHVTLPCPRPGARAHQFALALSSPRWSPDKLRPGVDRICGRSIQHKLRLFTELRTPFRRNANFLPGNTKAEAMSNEKLSRHSESSTSARTTARGLRLLDSLNCRP